MNRFLIVFIGLFLIACNASNERILTSAPDHIQFEIMRTADPATGEVPSHLRYYQLKGQRLGAEVNLYKTERMYPNSWRAVDDQFASLAITMIDYNKQSPEIMYFCTGEGWFNADASRGAGVWKSTDGGDSWLQLPSTDTSIFYYCQDLVVHPSTGDVYVTTRDAGLMRSQDGGNSWRSVLSVQNGSLTDRAADIEINGSGKIFVSFGMHNTDGIYYSETGDEGSWEKRVNGISNQIRRIELAVARSNDSVVYALVEGNDQRIKGIFRSNDLGMQWKELNLPGGDYEMAKRQAWYDLIIQVDPNDENVVAIGGLNIWRTRDGGTTWQQLTEGSRHGRKDLQYVHVDQHEIVFQNSDTVYFTNDGGIYRTNNFTADTPFFFSLNQNYNVTQFYSCDIEPKENGHVVIGGTQDNGSSASTESGISDFEQLSWADGSHCAVDHENGEYFYTTTQYRRILRTHNGILDTLTNPYITDANTFFINPIVMDPNDPTILYQATNRGLWRLKNARTASPSTWQQCTRTFGAISAIAVSKSEPNLVYVGRNFSNVPFKIENAHITDANYTPISMDRDGQLPTSSYLNCIVIDPDDAAHVLLIYSNYNIKNVWETYNALDFDPDWKNIDGNLPDMPVRWGMFHPQDPSKIILATEFGVYFADTIAGDSSSWILDAQLPKIRFDMIKYRESDTTIVLGSHGRGIYTGKVGSNQLITWEERGPSNVGGRTRTLLIDPNRNGNKLWAGSVSGGLWTVEDVDSVHIFTLPPKWEGDWAIYPNPSDGFFNVGLPDNDLSKTIKIYNRLGQLVKEFEVSNQMTSYFIDLRGYSNGLYFVELITGDQKLTKKIIIGR